MRRLSDVLRTMNFGETEEQNMIRNMVRDFAEEILLPTTLASAGLCSVDRPPVADGTVLFIGPGSGK